MAYEEWRNNLYKAGCAEAIVRKDNRRLLTLGELEAAGQFFRHSVFVTSSRERISIAMAMSQVSLNRRIAMEITPKPRIPGLSHPGPNNKRKPDGRDVPTSKPGLSKTERKKQKLADSEKVKVMAKWVERLPPYHKFGYDKDGNKMRDPNSAMSKTKDASSQNGKGKAGRTNLAKGGWKGGASLTTVRETSPPNFSR